MQQVFARVKKIILSPQEALGEVKSEAMGVTQLMKEYVVFVAAIPSAAMLIGMIGRVPFFRALIYCALSYAVALIGVFVSGKIIDALAGQFNSTRNEDNAFKLVAYSFTPSFVAGILNINPSLNFLVLLGSLYGAYIFYIGLPELMETPEEKRLVYAAISIIAILVVMVILMSIVGAVAWGGTGAFRY